MSLSIGNLAVGFIIGATIGFGATQFVSRSKPEVDLNIVNSQSTPANHSVQQPALVTKNNETITTAAKPQPPAVVKNASVTPTQTDFDITAVSTHHPFSQGFSAELALMNNIANASFDQLENLAYELLSNQSNMSDSSAYTLSIISARMFELDKQRTESFFEQNIKTGRYGNMYPVILNVWATVDPEAAMEWASNQPQSMQDFGSREMIISQWLMIDPEAASAYLQTIDDPDLKAQMDMQITAQLAERNPRQAIEKALAIEDADERRMMIEMAMYSWSNRSVLDAIDFATHSLNGVEQERAFEVLGNTFAMHGVDQLGQSPLEIMQMADAMPPTLRVNVRRGTLQRFFQEDPDGAMQWLDSVSDAQERNQLLESIAWVLPQYDLAMAQSLFEQSDANTQSMLAPGIAQKLFESDSASAWYWHDQITDERSRQDVFYSLVHMEARANPEEAMRLAMNASGPESADLMFGVFSSAAYEHPEWAQQWVEQANVGEEQRAILRDILKSSRYDPVDYYQTEYRIEQ